MKKTNRKTMIEKVAELNNLRAQMKELKALESEIKADIEGFMGDDVEAAVGHYLLKMIECERVNLDRGALVDYLGEEKIKEFEKVSHYTRLNIKAS